MRFSIWPSAAQPTDEIIDVATHADATGWDRVYMADHFMAHEDSPDRADLVPVHEATALISAMATATSRVGLAHLVLSVTFRHPAVVANWAATVDHLSHGRLILGLGAGWQENEHNQYGLDLGSPGERVDRFAEAIEVVTSLLGEKSVDFDGDHYRLSGAVCEPKPVQEPVPILVGAKGTRMLKLVARYADEWNTWGLPELVAARHANLVEQCEIVGRNPDEIDVSCQALWRFDGSSGANVGPPPSISGSVEQMIDHVAAWQAIGVDDVIVPDGTLGSGAEKLERMDLIIQSIAPHFRGAVNA